MMKKKAPKKSMQNLVVAVMSLLVLFFGVLPILNRDEKDLEKFGYQGRDTFDVIVIGSEPEGIAAAVAAARSGMNTLLLTKEPDSGSYMTDCLINHMSPQIGRIAGKKTALNGLVFSDLFGNVDSTFTTTTYMNNALRVMVKESKLQVFYEATVTGVDTSGGRVDSLSLYTKEGSKIVQADIYMDATEDGVLLEKLDAPYLSGSEDIGADDFYEPVSFQFRLRGILWDDMKKIAKVEEFSTALADMLIAYPRTRPDIKIVSPALIRQDDDTVLVSGLQVGFVDVEDSKAVTEAYNNAMREAMHLTAYLQAELVPFKDAEWDIAASRLYIPEKRHYVGLETLTVSDILNNKDRDDKIALLSEPPTANRFVRGDDPALLCKPNVYAVPIGCILPKDWKNVMMLGGKASFASLASTSAGTISSSVEVGEGAGLAAAYCILDNIDPADVPTLPKEKLDAFVAFLSRAGQVLPNFFEPMVMKDGNLLSEAWMQEAIEDLVAYGILLGGAQNDFRVDEGCSDAVALVLVKNALLRKQPAYYTLDLDSRLATFQRETAATPTSVSTLLLEAAAIPRNSQTAQKQLLIWLEDGGIVSVPPQMASFQTSEKPLTNGELYFLTYALCERLAANGPE